MTLLSVLILTVVLLHRNGYGYEHDNSDNDNGNSNSNGHQWHRNPMHHSAKQVQEAMGQWQQSIVAPIPIEPRQPQTWTAGQHEFQIPRPEGNRTYYVWVPTAYTETDYAVPLHLSFHGLGDTCLHFAHSTGFIPLTEIYNFLYVYPCATVGPIGTGWNAGTCCIQPTKVDDVEFTRLIINDMFANFRVNTSQVFISGFSNGAMMAEILICEIGDLLTATASVSGVVELEPGNTKGEVECTADYAKYNNRVSQLNIHGTLDPLVPWTGDAFLGFPPIPTDFDDWANRNDCAGTPVQTFNKGDFSNQRYTNCSQGAIVELVKNIGGGHEWPINPDFDTTTYILNWFFNETVPGPL